MMQSDIAAISEASRDEKLAWLPSLNREPSGPRLVLSRLDEGRTCQRLAKVRASCC